MNWTKIDPERLPEGEVLAACFETGGSTKGYGTLKRMKVNSIDSVVCEQDFDIQVWFCTHYIDINKYDL